MCISRSSALETGFHDLVQPCWPVFEHKPGAKPDAHQPTQFFTRSVPGATAEPARAKPHSHLRGESIPPPRHQGVEDQEDRTASPRWRWIRLLKHVFALAMARAGAARKMDRSRRRRRLRPGLSAAGRAQDPHRSRCTAGRRLPDAEHLGVVPYRRR